MSLFRLAVLPGLRAALWSFRRAPLRSLVLLQGVMWATVFGVTPPAILRGSREGALERAAELGTDRVLIRETTAAARLTWEVARELGAVDHEALWSVSAYARRERALFVDSETSEDSGRVVVAGRWFTADELLAARAGASPVCLVSEKTARELRGATTDLVEFAEAIAGGIVVELPGVPEGARVIGVFRFDSRATSAVDSFGYREDHPLREMVEELKTYFGVLDEDIDWLRDDTLVVLPAAVAPVDRPDVVLARARPDRVKDVADELRTRLLRRGVAPTMAVNPVVQILFSEQLRTIEELHVVIFVVCLIVGVLVVTNSMILSILDRRREIAIRRVEGAHVTTIVAQVLAETGVQCLAGALVGIPVALGLAELRASLDPSGALMWTFPATETLQTVVAITVAGILGGLIPAVHAARVDPARVLGSE